MNKQLAVLLTVFNRKAQTLSCLDKLFKQDLPESYTLKVYLTDDGSTDGTARAVENFFHGKVTIIQGDGSLYWNRGMWTAWNYAVKEAKHDFFLWLNDDTELHDGALRILLETSYHYDDGAIIVGATKDKATHKTLTYGGRLADGTIPPCNGDIQEVLYFNGNIVLIPEKVYKKLGNLDFNFTHSKGDFDYGLRAAKFGIKKYQCGTVLGECDAHDTVDKWCDPKVPLFKRLQILRKPNGMPPNETFYFNRKYNGLFAACKSYLTIYIRCFFPNLCR